MRNKLKFQLLFYFSAVFCRADMLLSTEQLEEAPLREASLPEILNIILLLLCANVCLLALVWLISFLARQVKENAKFGAAAKEGGKEKDSNEKEQNNQEAHSGLGKIP